MAPRALPWTSEIRLDGPGPSRVMLWSGFGSSPETLRPLGEAIRAATGATVLLAGLADHAGDAEAFLQSRGWGYQPAADAQFTRFAAESPVPVVLGGYSTGALLAVTVAASHPGEVAGVVLASPAFRLARASRQAGGIAVGSMYYAVLPAAMLGSLLAVAWQGRRRGWGRAGQGVRALGTLAVFASAALGLRGLTVPLDPGSPVRRDGEDVLLPHFARASVLTGSTLVPLQMSARRALRSAEIPVCVVVGEQDAVVDVKFAARLVEDLPLAEVHVVEGAPHRVVTDERCCTLVSDFVARVGARSGR